MAGTLKGYWAMERDLLLVDAEIDEPGFNVIEKRVQAAFINVYLQLATLFAEMVLDSGTPTYAEKLAKSAGEETEEKREGGGGEHGSPHGAGSDMGSPTEGVASPEGQLSTSEAVPETASPGEGVPAPTLEKQKGTLSFLQLKSTGGVEGETAGSASGGGLRERAQAVEGLFRKTTDVSQV